MSDIFISGPMTGCYEYNYPLFYAVACDLALQGHTPLNPALGIMQHWTHQDYMARSIALLLNADELIALPGWASSDGACLEVKIASEIGIPISYATDEDIQRARAHFSRTKRR